MDSSLPDIVLTESDYHRLAAVLEHMPPDHPVASMLLQELDRADIVEAADVPPDVVTMNSRVVIEDADTSETFRVTLVYPSAADFEQGRLSITAPVGAALLGLRTGQTIDWRLPSGRVRRIRICDVEWQPEAAGQFHL